MIIECIALGGGPRRKAGSFNFTAAREVLADA